MNKDTADKIAVELARILEESRYEPNDGLLRVTIVQRLESYLSTLVETPKSPAGCGCGYITNTCVCRG